MIKLCKYCGSEPQHNKLIYYKGMTFVTNGYYVLRFSGRLEGAADATEKNRDMAGSMRAIFPSRAELAEMCHAPVDQRMTIECDNCNGRGFARKCCECDGGGVVVFENSYSRYECCCLSCDGYGQVAAYRGAANAERCSRCQGTGEEVDESQPVRIGKARLSPRQMHLLSRLPLIAWAAHGIHGHFVFFGGEGVLLGFAQSREDYSK